jgi:phosphotransferase system HPr-like phosphotransfer protein
MVETPPSPWAERRPVKQTVSVEDFRASLAKQAEELGQLANGLIEASVEEWTQRQLVQLHRSATEVEAVLDDHGAKRNSVFFRPREVVAIVRWLAAGLSSFVHVYGRLSSYELADREWTEREFAPHVRAAALRLGEVLHVALQGLRREWLRADMEWPQVALQVDSLGPLAGLIQLPSDRLEQEDAGKEEDGPQGPRLANRFLTLTRSWSSEAGHTIQDLGELQAFMANYCTEEIARRYEASVHNLQSSYDTRIAGTAEEERSPELRVLRGTASQVLHLLETVTCLTHLYERHDIYERAGESRALFEELVPEKLLLQTVVNDGVVAAYACLKRAQPVAEAILVQLSVSSELALELPEGVIMHARPLSLIVGIVQKHGTPVELELAGKRCSAASMMSMLVLVGTHSDERVYKFHGDPRPLSDLKRLFEHRLGEEGCQSFPDQIAYLRP